MKNVTFLVVALLAAVGCKKNASESGGAELAKLAELKAEMCACKDAKCAQDVSDKLVKWTQERAGKPAPKMSDADAKKAAAIGDEMGKCMQTAMAASNVRAEPAAGSDTTVPPGGSDTTAPPDMATGSATGSAATGSDGVPAECVAYGAQVEKLKTCEKLSPRVKEALVKAFNDAKASWAKMPEGAKTGLAESCKRGTEALIVAGKEACGW